MSNSTIGFSPSTLPELEAAKKVGSLDPRLSRTDYFDGRLLTATDLIRDQTYVDERVLEVGRALGSGVVSGLTVELSEDKRFLKVNPGLAITESGRVLEVVNEKPLEIDLYDRALLTELNKGRYQRFNRGLYAVTLQFVELGSDSAESYPADPTDEREFRYDSYVEGSEITLTPLNYPLPSDNELVSRSSLVKYFLRNPAQPPEISDQAISLAVLAINNDRPQWLDMHMIRRPMRPEHVAAAWQIDLHRHYLELFDNVMFHRSARSQGGEFSANQYFHLLPPAGVLPVGSVDPFSSVQYFFPENYEVSLAPVRYDDLSVIQNESMPLSPLDLDSNEAAEVMVLAPLSNSDFTDLARQLGFIPEADSDTDEVQKRLPNFWLHATDLLQLRLTTPIKPPSADVQSVWQDIWEKLGERGLLHYVRRPARAAETQVSSVVLAHGFEIPPPGVDYKDQIADLKTEKNQLIDDNSQLTQQLTECNDSLNETQEKLLQCEAGEELVELRAKVTSLNEEVSELTILLNECQDGLGTELSLCNNELNTTKEQLTSTDQKLSAATSQIALKDVMITDLNRQIGVLQFDLNECRNNTPTPPFDPTDPIDPCLLDPRCIERLLGLRGITDPRLLNEATSTVLTAAEASFDDARQVLAILENVPTTHEALIWPTISEAVNTGKIDQLNTIISGSGSISEIGTKLSNDTSLNLSTAVVDGWGGKGDLAINLSSDATSSVTSGSTTSITGTTGTSTTAIDIVEIDTVLNLRGTTDTVARDDAISAIETVKDNPVDVKSTETIINNVSGNFDAALWSTVESATKAGTLQELEAIAVTNANDPVALAKAVVDNSSTLGIDATTADRWTTLGGVK